MSMNENALKRLGEQVKNLSILKNRYEAHLSLHCAAVLAGDKKAESDERMQLHAILDLILDESCGSGPIAGL